MVGSTRMGREMHRIGLIAVKHHSFSGLQVPLLPTIRGKAGRSLGRAAHLRVWQWARGYTTAGAMPRRISAHTTATVGATASSIAAPETSR